ncbi:hypothetical protein ACTFIZ_011515 [Dictyostelium cf. discoideum]
MSIAYIPDNGFFQTDSCLEPRGRVQPNVFNMFLCICISQRDPNHNNTFKCVALLFNGTISRENPVSIISFGTKPISQRNENQYQTITNKPIQFNVMHLSSNVFSIPSAIIFNGVPNPPTNIPPALNLDLFYKVVV